jgi:Leucine-rich repeat (LRR) protein
MAAELKSTMKIPEIVYRAKQTSVVLTRPVLKQQYLTPTDMDLPKYTNKTIKSLHQGIPISETTSIRNRNENIRSELDGFYLLECTGMGFPEDAQQAVLSDKKLTSVVADDFTFFTEMLYVDVSENFLSMEPFGAFPKLRELRMACNRISSFGEYRNSLMGFNSLMYLDLSYNKLTPDSILSLDVLPQLRELDLCGNNLKTLPEDLTRFFHLERLLLDYNQIGDNAVFQALATVSSLRQLSLANNFLSIISWEACSEGLK